MQVKFWDGVKKNVANREEAVRVLKSGLQAWMQKGDTIRWYKRPEDPNPPMHAFVFNELGEETDVWATITEAI